MPLSVSLKPYVVYYIKNQGGETALISVFAGLERPLSYKCCRQSNL